MALGRPWWSRLGRGKRVLIAPTALHHPPSPADHIRLGDRSTARKAAFEAPLAFAAPFMSVHGPGVASLDTADAVQVGVGWLGCSSCCCLCMGSWPAGPTQVCRPPPAARPPTTQVHSLPGLEPLSRMQLEDSRALGYRWSSQPLLSQGSGIGGSASGSGPTAACSLDGQLMLVGAGNELARLAVVADCAVPAPPTSLYDMRVAQAAAAAAAAAAASGQRRLGARVEPPAAVAQQDDAAGAGTSGGAAPSPQGASFGRFFDQAASTVSGLASTAAGSVLQVRGAGDGSVIWLHGCVRLCSAFRNWVHPPHAGSLPLPQELDRARAAGQSALQRISEAGGGGGPSRPVPTLQVLFATAVEPLEDDDLDYLPET